MLSPRFPHPSPLSFSYLTLVEVCLPLAETVALPTPLDPFIPVFMPPVQCILRCQVHAFEEVILKVQSPEQQLPDHILSGSDPVSPGSEMVWVGPSNSMGLFLYI